MKTVSELHRTTERTIGQTKKGGLVDPCQIGKIVGRHDALTASYRSRSVGGAETDFMAKHTITDIARLCGTSPATVSRVFNRPELVAAPLRERILRVVDEVGYKPHPFASRLSSTARWGLALFVFDILNPFFAMIVRRIGHMAMEQGVPLTVCDTENNQQKEEIYLDFLLDHKIGGIIFAEGISHETIERARESTATVLIDRRYADGSAPEVSSDNFLGGCQATRHILDLGHRRIAFVGGPEGWVSAEERYRGFRETLRLAGVPFDEQLFFRGDLRFEAGSDALDYFANVPDRPSAIFCANDQMAFGALTRAHMVGVAVPEEMSIVGFDAIPRSAMHTLKLTTVKQDIDALCTHAFSIMQERYGNGGVGEKRHVIVPTRLEEGETCAPRGNG